MKTLDSLLLVIVAVLAPLKGVLITVMMLPLVDLLLALICAKKSKVKITSSGLKRTIAKVLMYEIATVLAFMTETWLTGDLVPAIKIVTGLIGVTELKSCLEHLDDLNGMPLFTSILSRLAPPPIDLPQIPQEAIPSLYKRRRRHRGPKKPRK